MGSRSGQVLFLLFALGGVQVQTNTLNASASQGSGAEKLLGYYYISITFGLSLFGIASIFYNVTGSLLVRARRASATPVGAAADDEEPIGVSRALPGWRDQAGPLPP